MRALLKMRKKGFEMRSASAFLTNVPAGGRRTTFLLAAAGLALILGLSGSEAAIRKIAQGGVVFTADELGSTVSRLDLSTGKVTTVPVAVSPHNVQITANGQTLLVVGTKPAKESDGHGNGGAHGTLLVFDTAQFRSKSPLEVQVGEHPAHVVADPVARYALVTNSEDDNVSVIDLTSATPRAVIATGGFPHGLRISPDGNEAYVANVKDGTVSVLDLGDTSELARTSVGKAPCRSGSHRTEARSMSP
ncbi:YncE family protein [Ensifer sesbaniae]|nr:YncE family protein [Ensifer sesbaniae]